MVYHIFPSFPAYAIDFPFSVETIIQAGLRHVMTLGLCVSIIVTADRLRSAL